jgi:L-arabinose isomerase
MNFCIPSPSSEISNFEAKESIKDEQENESKYDLFCQALQSLKIDKDVAKLSVAEETFSPAPYL